MSPFANVGAPVRLLLLAACGLALVATPLAGCGSVEQESGVDAGNLPDALAPDETPPTVVSVTPTDGAIGVAADATIVVEFSEPMDQLTVEGAFASDDLGSVALSWNAAGDTLTITPEEPLDYAEGFGTDPDEVDALVYGLSLGVLARDLAGHAIEEPFEMSFSTRKRMTAEFPRIDDLTRYVVGNGNIGDADGPLVVGDNSNNESLKTLLTFDLADLPEPVYAVESAAFSARQTGTQATPYESLGAIVAHHLVFEDVTPDLIDADSLAVLGVFSTDDNAESKSIEVSEAVADDVANHTTRGARSQYRLEFEEATDGNETTDFAGFARETFALSIVYVTE
jgi:hypothetical protein